MIVRVQVCLWFDGMVYTWIWWLYIHIHYDIVLNSSSKIVSALPTAPHYNIHIIFILWGWATSSENKMNITQAMVQRFVCTTSQCKIKCYWKTYNILIFSKVLLRRITLENIKQHYNSKNIFFVLYISMPLIYRYKLNPVQ